MKIFIWLCLVLTFLDLSLCADPVNIPAEPGQNVILSCRAAGNGIVTVVRLTRDDLKPDCVLLYRNDQIDEEQQNPQYQGRTKVQSLTSTDAGQVNLTLNNVTEKDSGEYECRVRTEMKRRKRSVSERTIIHLSVAAAQSNPPADPPGNQDGRVSRSHAVLLVALSAAVVIVSMVMITAVRRKKMETRSPPDDAEKPVI